MSKFQDMWGCEMWFVLSLVRTGNIICRVTGKTLAVGVRERGAGGYLGLRRGE